MAVSPLQFQRDLSVLTERVDDLDLVVNGDADRDVAGVRPRLSAVEAITKELAEARADDRKRWAWTARGIGIGLAFNIIHDLPGIIQFITTQVLPLLGGHP